MEPLDNYQNRILETNESTREQIDIIFENVAEVDQRYAEIFRSYQETVKEQTGRNFPNGGDYHPENEDGSIIEFFTPETEYSEYKLLDVIVYDNE